MNIPINHKTIFLFDHSNYFSSSSNCKVDFDVAYKNKSASNTHMQKLEPLNKSLWTSSLEAAFEYSRIVYDLFPESKLIRTVVTKFDCALNGWNIADQGLENLMSIMGNIIPPMPQLRQLFDGEEFINLCKALNIAVNSIAQTSELQQNLCVQFEKKSSGSGKSKIPNSGRIIVFSSAKNQNIDQIQEFLNKAIEECNKNIEQVLKTENVPPSCLRINKIELVIIDVVPCDHALLYEKELIRQNSNELRTRILSSKAGKDLPMKLIELVKNFYELSVTSVTNIPMKEELNANSSANYDVDILHDKSLHDQLKSCRIIKNCISIKDGKEAVCLKWSNPKTNITEFNFSSSSSRITPIDVNSRPASCLTSFLLGGRCVVLEVPRLNNSNNRVSSHVLCAQGNEIFMHCLNCCGKSNLDDRPSIEDTGSQMANYRSNEFIEFIRSNTLSNSWNENAKENFNVQKYLDKLEKQTRKWPILYDETLVGNYFQLVKLVKSIGDEKITDNQFAEDIKIIEYFQHTDLKAESMILPVNNLKKLFDFELIKDFWNELESWLNAYQDISEKHKALYNHAKKIRDNFLKANENNGLKASGISAYDTMDVVKKDSNISDYLNNELEAEKLSKRRKINRDSGMQRDEKNLLDFWTNMLNEKNKKRVEFYGRVINPNNTVTPLYTHLEEISKNSKQEMA